MTASNAKGQVIAGLLVSVLLGSACLGPHPRATRPAATQAATQHNDVEAAKEAMIAYLDAAIAQDRKKLQELVLLPTDEQRRQWVLGVIGQGELPPAGTKRLAPTVQMDGPVAVGRVEHQMRNGSMKPSKAFLVRREGRWKVAVDYFEGGDLKEAEMEVISRHLEMR